MKVSRIFQSLWLARWWNCVIALVRHAKIHPSAFLFGNTKRIQFADGTIVGARTRLDVSESGRIVLGERVWLSSDVEIQTDTLVYVGAGTTIQRRCTINGSSQIGAGCIFAPNVFISSGTHPFRSVPYLPIREQERRLTAASDNLAALDRPVWVQDDCWLGTNCVISPGVTIGRGSVIGANSVVTHDVSPYSVVAGAPAKVIGQRMKWSPKRLIDPSNEQHWPYVLSGSIRISSDSKQASIELTYDVPLRIALSSNGEHESVIFHLETQFPVVVESSAQMYEINAGNNKLEISAASLIGSDGNIYCDLKLSDMHPGKTIRVTRIEASSA